MVNKKATLYMRRCKRCDILYKTKYKASKICPNCKIPIPYHKYKKRTLLWPEMMKLNLKSKKPKI